MLQAKRGLANALFAIGRSEEGLSTLRDVIATRPKPSDLERVILALLSDPNPSDQRLKETQAMIERLWIERPKDSGTQILAALSILRSDGAESALLQLRDTKVPSRMRNYACSMISMALHEVGRSQEAVSLLREVVDDLGKTPGRPAAIVGTLVDEASKTLGVPVLGLGH